MSSRAFTFAKQLRIMFNDKTADQYINSQAGRIPYDSIINKPSSGIAFEVVSSLPGSPRANTIYFVTG
jgi:hypothetical protein